MTYQTLFDLIYFYKGFVQNKYFDLLYAFEEVIKLQQLKICSYDCVTKLNWTKSSTHHIFIKLSFKML